ncbi:arylsulfotransferase protein, partial [Teratosphaeria destructans]
MAVRYVLALFTCPLVQGALDLAFGSDDDLTTFVTRPEIRAPILDVEVYDREAVRSGKWFVAPYADIAQQRHARNYYQPCQTGPAIYDLDGELIWSGACMLKNRNTCDFRPFDNNGTNYLSMIVHGYPTDSLRHGLVLDNSYRMTQEIDTGTHQYPFNMHELQIQSNGIDEHSTALYILNRRAQHDVTSLGIENVTSGWVGDTGFREVDLTTGASTGARDGLDGPPPKSWNWFHMNSVAKNPAGDYLVSARWTNTLYKISGRTGRILWRLGGPRSSSSSTASTSPASTTRDGSTTTTPPRPSPSSTTPP